MNHALRGFLSESPPTYSRCDSEVTAIDIATHHELASLPRSRSSTIESHPGSIDPSLILSPEQPLALIDELENPKPFTSHSSTRSSSVESASEPVSSSELGRKEFRCPECGKPFLRRWNMNQHRRTHDKQRKRWPCPYSYCNSNFTRESDLRRHRLDSHKERGKEDDLVRKSSSSQELRGSPPQDAISHVVPHQQAPPKGRSKSTRKSRKQPGVISLNCGCILIACSSHGHGHEH
jgi:hypothetical protein